MNSVFPSGKKLLNALTLTFCFAALGYGLFFSDSTTPVAAQEENEQTIWLPIIHKSNSGTSTNPELEVTLTSGEPRAEEGDDTGVSFRLTRLNDSAAATFPITINNGTARRIALANQAHLNSNPEPQSEFFFSDNVLFCNIGTSLSANSTAMAAAGAEDYTITDEDGLVLSNAISFSAGETEKLIIIKAISDDQTEVPEKVEVSVQPAAGYSVRMVDQIDVDLVEGVDEVTDNSVLFVGQLTAEGGAATSATGLTTLRLAEDNSFALVSMSFSGLTSEQTAAHIHIANPDSGPVAFSLPLGQFSNINWGVKAAQFITTDQEMLDRLFAGGLYTNVHTTNYPAGEIKSVLIKSDGTGDPIYNYPTPETEVLAGDDLQRDIIRFLRQSTFGPTPELVADLEARITAANGDRIAAYSAWLDEQMQLESPSHHAYYLAARAQYLSTVPAGELQGVASGQKSRNVPFHVGWFTSSVHSKAHLRERVGFALSEIFVTSAKDNQIKQRIEGLAAYNDMLKENAFGDYETLLTDVSKHPVMGIYLSHLKNKQEQYDEDGNLTASPDENYAREVMQLFSIGLVDRHPDYLIKLDDNGLPVQSYTQTDITELARVFTGWSFSVRSREDGLAGSIQNTDFEYRIQNRADLYHPYLVAPMKSFNDNGLAQSDKKYEVVRDQGEKVILGETFPAGQTGEEDLAQIMDILSNHPNTAPFISYRLIQRLVTSNPSAGYIYRVSTTFSESGGDMGETVKAILLDPEARNLDTAEIIGYGRVQEPLVRSMNMMRLMDVEYVNEADYPVSGLSAFGLSTSQLNLYENDVKRISLSNNTIESSTNGYGQAALSAPTVFNWFMPNFTPAGPIAQAGLVAPELQHMNATIAVNYYNHINSFAFINGSNGPRGYEAVYDEDGPRPVMIDLPQAVAGYMAVMDTNNDGTISELDSTFDDDGAVRQATAAVVDAYDLYVCDGWFKARATGNSQTDAREIIIDSISGIHSYNDGRTEEKAIQARNHRLREAFLIMFTAPQCMVQK